MPGSFVEPWDDWLQQVLPQARAMLADAWEGAWLQAPVWRFLLPTGQCGPAPVIGLWLPSVDASGRFFPLTLAAILPGNAVPRPDAAEAWLDQAEQAGRDALDYDVSPEDLASRLTDPPSPQPAAACRFGRWWTDGGPYVPAGKMELPTLPDATCFATMLRVEPRPFGSEAPVQV